jgi:hypothetical protein
MYEQKRWLDYHPEEAPSQENEIGTLKVDLFIL